MGIKKYVAEGEPMRTQGPLGETAPEWRPLNESDYNAMRGEGPEQQYGLVVAIVREYQVSEPGLVYLNPIDLAGEVREKEIRPQFAEAMRRRYTTLLVNDAEGVQRVIAASPIRTPLDISAIPEGAELIFAKFSIVTDGKFLRCDRVEVGYLLN